MQYKHLQYLPTEEDLPNTDSIPLDKERSRKKSGEWVVGNQPAVWASQNSFQIQNKARKYFFSRQTGRE